MAKKYNGCIDIRRPMCYNVNQVAGRMVNDRKIQICRHWVRSDSRKTGSPTGSSPESGSVRSRVMPGGIYVEKEVK
jgi:hypothetical protein